MFFRLWKVLQGSQAKLQNTETFLIQFNEQGSRQAGECQWKTIYVMEQKQAQEAGDVVMKKVGTCIHWIVVKMHQRRNYFLDMEAIKTFNLQEMIIQ